MAKRDLTIVVLGPRGRTAEAAGRALAALRRDGTEADLVAGHDGPAAQVARRCAEALDGDAEPVLLRVRVDEDDPPQVLLDGLAARAQQDLQVEAPPPAPARQHVPGTWRCACDGYGCVQCMGEACP